MIEHVIEGCQCKGKFCTKCDETRCIGAYTRDKKRADKLDAWCRYCNNAQRKAYRQANKEKARAAQELSYRKNISHYRAYQQAYRQKHSDEINRKFREAKYYTTQKARARISRYRRTKWREQRRREYLAYRARKRDVGGTYTVLEWQALKAQYDYRCLCCGRREPEIKLTVDHVIPLVLRGRNSTDNIQPLCLSCNSRKQAKVIDYRRSYGIQSK